MIAELWIENINDVNVCPYFVYQSKVKQVKSSLSGKLNFFLSNPLSQKQQMISTVDCTTQVVAIAKKNNYITFDSILLGDLLYPARQCLHEIWYDNWELCRLRHSLGLIFLSAAWGQSELSVHIGWNRIQRQAFSFVPLHWFLLIFLKTLRLCKIENGKLSHTKINMATQMRLQLKVTIALMWLVE